MAYVRPSNQTPISPDDKPLLVANYLSFYQEEARIAKETGDFSTLNSKLPRAAAASFLDKVGNLLNDESKDALNQDGAEIKAFLRDNPLPVGLEKHLPDDFRAHCLLLNALKQWVSAESAATDRYLLGGQFKKWLKNASDTCMVTAGHIDKVEYHHPARDGRPPIPLSPKGHNEIEMATEGDPGDSIMTALRPLKERGHFSWIMLRDGCNDLDESVEIAPTRTRSSLSSCRTFARKAMSATRLDCKELIKWLDTNQLGL